MAYELIITEKPAAAKKIASALADGKLESKKTGTVASYWLTRGGKRIAVACAVGHLYNLEGVEKRDGKKVKARYTYPVLEVQWKPAYEVAKQSAFTRKYLEVLESLGKGAESFVIATDYDVEGELIGLNVLRFACGQKDASRMKFSTLTDKELQTSYDKRARHLDWNLARAGETRHILDWLYGINLSRALTLSIKRAGRFRVLSAGRVQGPALNIIVAREQEVAAFIPKPYWEVLLHLRRPGHRETELVAQHASGRFWEEPEAKGVMERISGKHASVHELKAEIKSYLPPHPFDLTTLQLEANRCLGLRPKDTLDSAQRLYLAGLISYPRTSGQKLPPSIGYQNILQQLAEQKEYAKFAEELLKGALRPNEGSKEDSAHPAIYPTGVSPSKLSPRDERLYDLIVRRFLSTFAEASQREHITVTVACGSEHFKTSGAHTVKPGWQLFYGPYVMSKEVQLPPLKQNEPLEVTKNEMLSKETQPPRRYSQASLVRELANRNLGTKATRAVIVDHLLLRGYVFDEPLHATSLGMAVVDTLTRHCPEILDEELTRRIEMQMERIETGKEDEKHVLSGAKEVLLKVLEKFRKDEEEIGKELVGASDKSWTETHEVGPCVKCEGTLVIKRGRFGSFVACNRYPDCKVSFKLPASGKVLRSDKICEACKSPYIKIIRVRRHQELCINADCPSKRLSEKDEKRLTKLKKTCPKCGKDMVLRRSIYGEFFGCSGYPQCRSIERIEKPEPRSSTNTARHPG